MPPITPCLWFDNELAEAVEFYTAVFPNSSAEVNRAGDRVVTAEFDLDGNRFTAINGGPVHAGFSESISFTIACADQAEVDRYWELLGQGGHHSRCGWLKDRYGLSWQVIPTEFYELASDPDPVRSAAVMECMLGMDRLVVADLRAAADAARPSGGTPA